MTKPDEGYPDHQTVDVQPLDCKTLVGDGILEVTLGPCVGVSIYDPSIRTGFLGHFADQDVAHRDLFETFLRDATDKIPDLSTVRIWLGGAETGFGSNLDEITLRTRRLISARVKEVFGDKVASLRESWLDGHGSLYFSIDVETGEEIVEIQDDTYSDDYGFYDDDPES
ncbi:MAG TPA: hypothetical protein VMR18_04365 [Candidatus Saccharimonadales bacterium]|jgi:hypothetical protein|nr:hypothetical protein [Candidatus Saccharimonadales bacterium]